MPLHTRSSSSSPGDDNHVELLSDLQTNSDSEMMETVVVASMSWAQDIEYLKLAATASSNFYNFGDDDDAELSIHLKTYCDLEVIESSVATAVPLAKVGYQKLAAKASCSTSCYPSMTARTREYNRWKNKRC